MVQRAHRPVWMRPWLPAVGAGAPEVRVGAGAGRAKRFGQGAATDRRVRAATDAVDPPLPAGPTPRPAGGVGDHTRCLLAADLTRQGLRGHAAAAERPVGGADADRSAPPAAQAGLLVGGVGDQAVRTQWSALLVAGGGFLHGCAARAGLGAGLGHAVAAQPLPLDSAVQPDDPLTRWAGRADDRLGPGVAESLDQPQHAGCTGMRAVAGEQCGGARQKTTNKPPQPRRAPPVATTTRSGRSSS